LFGLEDDLNAIAGGGHDLVSLVADDESDGRWVKRSTKLDDLPNHREAGDRMEELRQARLHPRTLAGGQNHDADTLSTRGGRTGGRF